MVITIGRDDQSITTKVTSQAEFMIGRMGPLRLNEGAWTHGYVQILEREKFTLSITGTGLVPLSIIRHAYVALRFLLRVIH